MLTFFFATTPLESPARYANWSRGIEFWIDQMFLELFGNDSFNDFWNECQVWNRPIVRGIILIQIQFLQNRSDNGSLLTPRKTSFWQRWVAHQTYEGQQDVDWFQQNVCRNRIQRACLCWRSDENTANFLHGIFSETREFVARIWGIGRSGY